MDRYRARVWMGPLAILNTDQARVIEAWKLNTDPRDYTREQQAAGMHLLSLLGIDIEPCCEKGECQDCQKEAEERALDRLEQMAKESQP